MNPARLRLELPNWWIALGLGHRYVAMYGNGRTESWATSEIAKGAVFSIAIGRMDP